MNFDPILRHHGMLHVKPKLAGYVHVDELQDMREGAFFRWFHVDRRQLTNGAFLASVQIFPDGIFLTFKKLNRLFSMWADDVVLFKKENHDDYLRRALQEFT